MKTIYLSKSDVKPLSLLPGGIYDSGRNALTYSSRCVPSDDRVHEIPCFDNDDAAWRPFLDARPSVVFYPCRAAAAFWRLDTRRHKSVAARLSNWLSRPGWLVGYRFGYPKYGHQGGDPVFSTIIIHIDESNCIISQLYVLNLCNWFEWTMFDLWFLISWTGAHSSHVLAISQCVRWLQIINKTHANKDHKERDAVPWIHLNALAGWYTMIVHSPI